MGPKRIWLKLDNDSKVRVRVGATNLEIRVIIPAKR
jgi:hypothetical protein